MQRRGGIEGHVIASTAETGETLVALLDHALIPIESTLGQATELFLFVVSMIHFDKAHRGTGLTAGQVVVVLVAALIVAVVAHHVTWDGFYYWRIRWLYESG